ncbi:Protein of unknown function [Salegentibacter echinorum]|uniref:DUF2891 domain-containing protein n=1 Tax=Salegentibacter echinorum TaxID=1073325 RepID=A0A1M5F801_SALEC|nr:DUF2891 domain-containing protein [Salegentibacter echinorum]SHF87645.1 Protein of unknown function [Salegentibacter echinorum]
MKKVFLLLLGVLICSCKGDPKVETKTEMNIDSINEADSLSINLLTEEKIVFTLSEANKLAEMPLSCLNTEYPNKLNQVLENEKALGEPSELHPAFYGCFDWHSSVHAHWSLVSLLKQFPDLEKAAEIRKKLQESLSKKNIQGEIAYFKRKESGSFERTYGWAWLLKLSEEIETWEDPMAKELENNLAPLTSLIVEKYLEFLPKLNYPIRVGEHSNTAFGLSFAYDYAQATKKDSLMGVVSKKARDFYLNDDNCPLGWEPSGFDFLSPCLEEVSIMRRVLPKNAFQMWLGDFMPQLKKADFNIPVAEVSDRTDGKLVHLDGLNFSRAWVFYDLISKYPDLFSHLQPLANRHIKKSFPNVVGDSYEGGHWLGTFAIYALQESKDI